VFLILKNENYIEHNNLEHEKNIASVVLADKHSIISILIGLELVSPVLGRMCIFSVLSNTEE
jgi:hypothetical protein